MSRRSGAVIRTVSWMSMAGICVGVAALIVVIGVMNGFNQVIRDRHLRVEPHLVLTAPEGVKFDDWLKEAEAKVSRALPGEVTEFTPYRNQDVILKTVDGYFSGAVVKGLDSLAISNFLARVEERSGSAIPLAERRDGEPLLEPGEIFIGDELGRALRLVPGDKVVLIPPESLLLPAGEAPPMQTVVVRDFFTSDLADVDGKLIVFDRAHTMISPREAASQVQGVELRIRSGHEYERAKKALASERLEAETWPDRNSALFFALKMEKLAMTIFLGLSALITSFSMVTVLVLLVTQKRKDIGILMAMGLDRKRTQRVFTLVGIWLSGFGVAAGIVIGVVVCRVIDTYPMDILPAIYYDRTIPAKVNPAMIVMIVGFASLIAVLGSWFPAHLSAKDSPAQALRGSKEL